jgi:hypothetical protein
MRPPIGSPVGLRLVLLPGQLSARPGNPSERPAIGKPAPHGRMQHYLDLILPPCAAICLFISMYAVLGIGLDWHSGTWRGDLLILLLAIGLPLVLTALRHWRRWRA